MRHLQAYIQRLFPESSVTAVKVGEGIVLRGWVTDPAHINQIIEIAEQFGPKVINQMKEGNVNQIQLHVKVMEVQRSRIRQLGFNWNLLGDNSYLTSTPGSLAPVNSISLPFGGPPTVETVGSSLAQQTINFGLTSSNSIFQGFLEALKQEGLLKVKSDTNLVTTSGRPANLLSGGEFPILVPQSFGNVTIQWREFGVRLEFVPFVLGGGNLRMDIAPEISERDFSNAVQVNGFTVPGLTTRRVNTQVEMKFGQTLIIGGLISTRYTAETDKLPLLGELPWIGAGFRRVRYDENETEMVILVTPQFVAPLDSNQAVNIGPGELTDIPTDKELFGQGFIEVPVTGGNGGYGSTRWQGLNGNCAPQSQIPQSQIIVPPSNMVAPQNVPLSQPSSPATVIVAPAPEVQLPPPALQNSESTLAPSGSATVPSDTPFPTPSGNTIPDTNTKTPDATDPNTASRWNPFKGNVLQTKFRKEQPPAQPPVKPETSPSSTVKLSPMAQQPSSQKNVNVESQSTTTITKPGLIRPADQSMYRQ
jgi:pilus assembly protein CpaC